jgi:hypothetical protein
MLQKLSFEQNSTSSSGLAGTWMFVAAMFAMMNAEDYISSQRSIGVRIFANCDTKVETVQRFSIAYGSASAALNLSYSFDPEIGSLLRATYIGSTLERNITSMQNMILSDWFPDFCTNLTNTSRTDLTNRWRNDMFTYLVSVVDSMRINVVLAKILQVRTVSLS